VSVLVLALALATGVRLESSGPLLQLHELIVRADVCLVGEIVEVSADTVQVEVEQLGFGELPGGHLKVRRFKDWRSARRWAPYEVGQRCLYFLSPSSVFSSQYRILGTHCEGEIPVVLGNHVAVRVSGGTPRTTPVSPLLEESRRYRTVFRVGEGHRWIEPAVATHELEVYRASSALADQLCMATFAGAFLGHYRDPAEPSPRPAEPSRLDLRVGPEIRRLTALPDLDGDGVSELLATQKSAVELLRPGADGSIRSRSWIRLPFGDCDGATACLGDLDGDGAVEVAIGGPLGRVYVVSLDVSGEVARSRGLRLGHGDFGRSLACLGDLDRDGTTELAASASEGEVTSVWIVSLDETAAVARARCVLDDGAALPGPLSLAALGDLDGDGTVDLAAAAPARWGSGRAGTLSVFLLEPDGSVRRRVPVALDARRGTTFGSALAGVGDWDGDHVPDLAVGAPHGISSVLFLERDGSVKGERDLAPAFALQGDASFGRALLALPPGQGGPRLLVAGFGAIETPPGSERWLRCYPSLWSFRP
jgi:hypothetical protein